MSRFIFRFLSYEELAIDPAGDLLELLLSKDMRKILWSEHTDFEVFEKTVLIFNKQQ